MVNLYEFLGIEKTDNVQAIQTAIEMAELEGKDAKLIAACKAWLLNDAKRAQYNQALNIKQTTAAPTVPVPPATKANNQPSPGKNKVNFAAKKGQKQTNAKAKSTPVWQIVAAVVLGLMALSAFVQIGKGSSNKYTMGQFQQINDGMSQEQLFATVGQGKVASQMDTTVIYQYVNKDGSNMIITVQDGRVIGKAQAGL